MKNTLKRSLSVFLAMLMLVSCWVFTPMAAESYSWSLYLYQYDDFYAKDLMITVNTADGNSVSYTAGDSALTVTGDYASSWATSSARSGWYDFFEKGDDQDCTISGTTTSYPTSIYFYIAQDATDSSAAIRIKATVENDTLSNRTISGGSSNNYQLSSTFDFTTFYESKDDYATGEYQWSLAVTSYYDFYAENARIKVVDIMGNTIWYNDARNNASITLESWTDFFAWATDTTCTFTGSSKYYPASITFYVDDLDGANDSNISTTAKISGVNTYVATGSAVTANYTSGSVGQTLETACNMTAYNPYPATPMVATDNTSAVTLSGSGSTYTASTNYVDDGNGQMEIDFIHIKMLDQYGITMEDCVITTTNASDLSLVNATTSEGITYYDIQMQEDSQSSSTDYITQQLQIRYTTTWNVNGGSTTGGYSTYINTTVTDADYTYTYYLNDGTSTAADTQTVNYGTPSAFQGSTADPTRENYTFLGWFSIKDDDVYNDDTSNLGQQLTLGSGVTSNTSWYASWAADACEVTLLYDDGSTYDTINVPYGNTYASVTGYADPTKDADNSSHYLFAGWTDSAGNTYNSSSKITSDITLTANFSTVGHSYSESDWATKTEASCSSNKIEYNTCLICKYEVTREVEGTQLDHKFTIKVDDESYDAELNKAGKEVYQCETCDETETTVLPALREITFDLGDNETYTATVTQGESLSAEQLAALAAETVVNDNVVDGYTYVFAGWKLDGSETIYTTETLATYVATNSEAQKFTPYFTSTENEYTFTYVIDGVSTDVTVKHGANILDTLKDVNTAKDSTESTIYTFDGWYIGETKVTDTDTIIADTTVTAKYDEETRTYTVTIDGTEYTVEYGEKLSADDVTNTDPTKAYDDTYHYTFSGWVLSTDETQSIFDVVVEKNISAVASFNSIAHTYGEWIVTEPATCTEKGSRYQTCSCGHTVTEDIEPTGHKYVETTTEAGQNTYGSIKWICSVCNDVDESRTEVIPALRNVIFYDENGTTVILNDWYSEGITFTAVPTSPSKDKDETYTYTFAGWLNSENKVETFEDYTVAASDTAQTFTASYNETYIEYTVTYTDELASHDSLTVHYGDKITLPTVEEEQIIEHTIYAFNGWWIGDERYASEAYYTVTGDTIITAAYYKEDIEYTIDFTSDDDYSDYLSVEDITGIYGETITLPTPDDIDLTESLTTIHFTYWTDESGTQYEGGDSYTITGDSQLTAHFETVTTTYTVTFVDDSGNVIDTVEDVTHNTVLTTLLPSDPTKEDIDYESFTFFNWTVDDETISTSTKVTSDLKVVANFTGYYKTWTVTFVDEDGNTVDTIENVQNGNKLSTTVTAPSKAYDDTYHYTFNMWVIDGTTLSAYDQNITADTTIAPMYIKTRHTMEQVYVLATEGVAGYTRWECTGCDYCYGEQELPALYTLTFYDEDKATVLSSMQKAKGTVIYTSTIETPVKSSVNGVVYTFSHWVDKDGNKVDFDNGYTISEAASFYAVFSEATYYTVKFLDYNGTLLQAKMYKLGTVLTADDLPEDPTRASSGYVSYVFDGWDYDPVGEVVDGELVFTAQYSETVRMCTVTYVYADGSEAAPSETVKAGSTVELPAFEMYIENDNDTHYVIESYTNAEKLVDISSDVEIVVNYTQEAHNFKVSTTNATCIANKTYVYTCSNCGCKITEEDEGTLTGHTWILKNTVSDSDGYYELYYCVYCGDEYKDYHYNSDKVDLTLNFTFTDHTAVSGARVDIYKNSVFITSTYTDASGNATISLYVDGTYTATLTGEEFATTSQTFTVQDGEVTTALSSITKADCSCTCHQDTFWGAIFRFFQKIGKLFTGKYGCCDCPSEMY